MDGISAGVDHNGNEPEHSVIITLLSFFLLPFHWKIYVICKTGSDKRWISDIPEDRIHIEEL